MAQENKKIWFVEFPTYRYAQDVKELARKHNVKIVNARFKAQFKEEDATDKKIALTLKEQYKPKQEEKQEAN